MIPLLCLLPFVWLLAYKQGRESDRRVQVIAVRPILDNPRQGSRPRPWFNVPAADSRRRKLTAANYLAHLNEAAAVARVLDAVKPAAAIADVAQLMESPPEVAEAFAALTAPIEVLFAQRDMNILGAEPPIPEDGCLGPETRRAIAHLQDRFGQEPSGRLDAQTAAAIRYSVGCIYSQDRARAV